MRKKGVNSIKKILQKIVKEQKFKEKLDGIDILDQLDNILGNNLKKYIINRYFHKGIIHLQLSSSVLRNEISYQKKELIDIINRNIGQKLVKDIILK